MSNNSLFLNREFFFAASACPFENLPNLFSRVLCLLKEECCSMYEIIFREVSTRRPINIFWFENLIVVSTSFSWLTHKLKKKAKMNKECLSKKSNGKKKEKKKKPKIPQWENESTSCSPWCHRRLAVTRYLAHVMVFIISLLVL